MILYKSHNCMVVLLITQNHKTCKENKLLSDMLQTECFEDGQNDLLVKIANDLKIFKVGYYKINNVTNKKTLFKQIKNKYRFINNNIHQYGVSYAELNVLFS